MNSQPQYIIDSKGDKVSVILQLADYQELLEDLEDLAAVAERRNEPTQSFEQVLNELGYDLPD
jgi:PHD/YefM family antitoxin component YafN of YafNO toxin-antitoxin module